MSTTNVHHSIRRRPSLPLVLASLIAALSLLALACNGGDDDGETGTPTGETASPDTSSPDPGASEVQGLATSALVGVDGKVVYDYTTEDLGAHLNGTWTTFRLGENRREDWQQNSLGFEAISRAAIVDGTYIICVGQPTRVPCREDVELGVTSVFVLFSAISDALEAIAGGVPNATVTELPDETIAETAATCFQINSDGRILPGPEGSEEAKVCFADDGALLLLERVVTFRPGDTARVTALATEVDDASPADFDLLAE